MGWGARLLIAEGHPLVHECLIQTVHATLPLIPIDLAATVAEAEALARLHANYQLAIVATDLPGTHGLSGFLQVQRALAHVPTVILSDSIDPDLAETARELGAAGYLSKTWPVDQLSAALAEVIMGGHVFPPVRSSAHGTRALGRGLEQLSAAQLRVLVALLDGRSNKQIAGDLGITEATVKAHLSACFRKLGVHNRAQAMIAMQPLLAHAG